MCHRMAPLTLDEAQQAMENLFASGHARVEPRSEDMRVPDAYPGALVPLFMPGKTASLVARELRWGFDAPSGARSRLLFNTRLDTACTHLQQGRGIWAHALRVGRCLVPVRAFFESWTRMPPRRGAQVRFTLAGRRVFLLAGIYEGNRFSVVTTEPNPEVGAVHSRMPLVLGPGESACWLGGDFARLADRSGIRLCAQAE